MLATSSGSADSLPKKTGTRYPGIMLEWSRLRKYQSRLGIIMRVLPDPLGLNNDGSPRLLPLHLKATAPPSGALKKCPSMTMSSSQPPCPRRSFGLLPHLKETETSTSAINSAASVAVAFSWVTTTHHLLRVVELRVNPFAERVPQKIAPAGPAVKGQDGSGSGHEVSCKNNVSQWCRGPEDLWEKMCNAKNLSGLRITLCQPLSHIGDSQPSKCFYS